MRLTITVVGRPAPQGSKRTGSAGQLLEQSPYLDAWRTAVKIGTFKAYAHAGVNPNRLPLISEGTPVVFELIEFRMMPSIQAAASPPGCAAPPMGPPDIDKLLRSTLDALGGRTNKTRTARLFADDAQVIEIQKLRKTWASPEQPAGATIIVSDGRD